MHDKIGEDFQINKVKKESVSLVRGHKRKNTIKIGSMNTGTEIEAQAIIHEDMCSSI